jgi:hypothetical protein
LPFVFPLPLYGKFNCFQTLKKSPAMQFEEQSEVAELDVLAEVTAENPVAQLDEEETLEEEGAEEEEEEMEEEEAEEESEEESKED